MNEDMKEVLKPVGWGFVVSVIALPFYLVLVFPEIGRSIMDTGAVYAILITVFASFLASSLMGDRELRGSMVMMVSASVFLTILLIFVLILPMLLDVVYTLDYYYLDIAKKMILAFMMFFPGLLVGTVIGMVFGDRYVSDISLAERKELNREMKEWKETLERAIMESEKGNGEESAENGVYSRDMSAGPSGEIED